MVQRFSPKDPVEVILVTFDYSDVLGITGETITSTAWSISVYDGVDPSPQTMLSGSGTFNNTSASNYIQGGVDGVTYLLSCVATTNSGETLKLSAHMLVKVQT